VSAEPSLLLVFCTVPDDPTAERLARGLVDARLAACVNVIRGVKSFYRWQGSIEVDDELQLVIKTRPGRFAELARWIKANHPYDVPEVVALPANDVSDDYLRWAIDQTAER
jgi:periplasmic divalent cation tolerance protein